MRHGRAVKAARSVVSVLNEAITKGEQDNLPQALPDEYEELFGRRPVSPLSPGSP